MSAPEPEDVIGKPTAWQRVVGIFNNPRATFASFQPSISMKDLALPLILVVAVSVAAQNIIRPLAIEEQLSRILQRDDLNEEQMDMIMERMEAAASNRGSGPVIIGALATVAGLAIITGIVMFFGNFILGGQAASGTVAFAIVIFASLIGILELAVKVPMMLQANSTQVQTGLDLLLPSTMQGSFIYRFFHRLDFFGMWKVFLTAMGTAILFRVSEQQARRAYFGAWAATMLLLAWLLDSQLGL